MLLNYLKVALRNLLKKKIFTIINVVGLSVGATSSLLIFLYVQDELSYDKFLPDTERLYRVVEDRIYPDRVAHFTVIPGGFSTVFPVDIPEIEASTRLIGFTSFAINVKYNDNVFAENYFFSADSNFFDVMKFKLLKGNADQILRHTNTIVLTQSTAAKYFGAEDPMGKTLDVQGNKVEVVGVMEDIPENSHLKFDALFPALGVGFLEDPSFYIAGAYTYIRLARGADPKTAEGKIPPLIEKYAAGQIERDMAISYKKYIENGNGYVYTLQPLADIHLYSHRVNEIKGNGNITAVRVLSFIGILIVVIAGINFINLATARSAERAREVGVRKVLGSKKQQLIAQFLSESMLISAISIVLAIFIVQLLIGSFNDLAQSKLRFDLIDNPLILVIILGVTISLGIVAGLYPAFYISTLKPVSILKGKFYSSAGGKLLRNGLVVFQFAISIILISATLVVYDQLSYMDSKSLGFQKEDVIVVNHGSQDEQSAALQNEIRSIPGVQSVGSSNSLPGGYYFGIPFKVQGTEEIFTPKGTNADDNYFSALKLKIVEGRGFSPDFDDSLSVVVNQKAVAAMNVKDPIGTVLSTNSGNASVHYTIVGVVEDYNYESLHTEIAPLIIMSTEGQVNFQSFVVVRLEAGETQKALTGLQSKWKEILPNEPFNFAFLDERLNTLYASENQSGKLLMMFTTVAIIIACVGLFGLAAYTANQRTKEIGVRKVLGASVTGIVGLLSLDFFKLVLIAMVVGTPVSYFLAKEWLESFAYRVPLGVMTFLVAGGIVLVFTAVTVSYQAINASMANPVESLKEE